MHKNLFIPLFILSIFSFLFIFGGCKKAAPISATTEPITLPPASAPEKRYLALGDSYTIGQGVATDQRFPTQAVSILRQENFKIKDPEYIATTGWTTQNLMNAINQLNPQGPYDLVTLLIGVNDQYQGMDTGGYRIRFTQLLNKSVELAGNKPANVIVLSIPDYSATPFVPSAQKPRVSREIDQFNSINYQVAQQKKTGYLEITQSTREAERDPSLIASDGLHPSGKEYKKWAERLVPMLKTILQ